MIFFDEKLSFLKEIDSRSNQSAKGSLPKIGCIKVDGPKRPQAGPKRPQAGPKRHNNSAQDSQERPKITKLLFEKWKIFRPIAANGKTFFSINEKRNWTIFYGKLISWSKVELKFRHIDWIKQLEPRQSDWMIAKMGSLHPGPNVDRFISKFGSKNSMFFRGHWQLVVICNYFFHLLKISVAHVSSGQCRYLGRWFHIR